MYTRYWIPYCRVLSKYSVWIYICCCHTETVLLQILHAEVYLICNADVVVVPWSSSSFSEGYARPMLMPSSHQQNLPGSASSQWSGSTPDTSEVLRPSDILWFELLFLLQTSTKRASGRVVLTPLLLGNHYAGGSRAVMAMVVMKASWK